MSTPDARASGETFINDLATESARIYDAFLELTEQRTAVRARVEAAGKRFAEVLSTLDQGSQELPLSVEALTSMHRTIEEPVTVNDVRLDSILHELAELKAEDADLLRKLAELAGDSEALVLRRDSQLLLSAQQEAHAFEKKALAEFTALQLKAGGANGGQPLATSEDLSAKRIRQIQGLDEESGSYTVSKLFDMYCQDHKHEYKDWANRVKRDYNPVRNMFISLFGDLRLDQLTVGQAIAFTEHAKSVSAASGGSQKNAEKKVGYLRAVFAWGRQRAMLPDLTGPLRVNASSISYEAYTPEELRAMFESEPYRTNSFGRSSMFWLPLLALYTGGRVEELASLRIDQVKSVDGGLAFLLSPGGKETGKNNFSKRTIPVHSALIRCGLTDYVETLRSEGHEILFPCTPNAARDGRGKAATRDFQAFRRDLGIGAAVGEGRGRKTLHSFRATFTTAMQTAGVSQEIRETITGHAKSGVHARIYSQGALPISMLVEAIERVRFDFEHPKWIDTPTYRRSRSRKPLRRAQK